MWRAGSGSGNGSGSCGTGEAEKEAKVQKEALDYLLDVAIEHFGLAARTVFDAIQDFNSTTTIHQEAINTVTFQKLQDTVSALATNNSTDYNLSNQIITVSPVYHASAPFQSVNWNLDFISDWVAREVLKRLNEVQKIEVRQVIDFFQGIPEAGPMVGSLFEPIAHNVISRDSGDGPWPLVRMDSNEKNPPIFVFPLEASPDILIEVCVTLSISNLLGTCPHWRTKSTTFPTQGTSHFSIHSW